MRAVLVSAMLLAATPVRADGLRCGERLVHLGDVTAQVLVKCGAPASRERHTDSTADGRFVTVETWVYNFGPQSFIRILSFVADRLVQIEAGDYGW